MNFLLRTCFDIIADQEFRYCGAAKLRVATHRHLYMTVDVCIRAHMRGCKIAPLLLCVGAVLYHYIMCVGAQCTIVLVHLRAFVLVCVCILLPISALNFMNF